jgi:hypothetical protein
VRRECLAVAENHTILEGKVHVYRRHDSPIWQCSTDLKGKNWRVSTKEDSLARAKDWDEDWYFGLKDKGRRGELLAEKTFKDAADQFTTEYEVLTGPLSPGAHLSRAVLWQNGSLHHQCRHGSGVSYLSSDAGGG